MNVETTTGAGVTGAQLGKLLAITPRRVRQLRDDGVFRQFPDGAYDVDECARALAVVRAGRGSPACRALFDDVEQLTHVVERGLERLERLPQAERFAVAAREVGPAIGRLAHMLNTIAATAPDGPRREFEQNYVKALCGTATASMLAALGAALDEQESVNA
jgi:hypothetical protein